MRRLHLIEAETGTNLTSKVANVGSDFTVAIATTFSAPISSGNLLLEASMGMATDSEGNPTDFEVVFDEDLSLPSNSNTDSWLWNLTAIGYTHLRVRTSGTPSVTVSCDIVIKE